MKDLFSGLNMRATALRAAASVIFAATCLSAGAEAFPSAPIKLVIGFAPGGATDAVARLLSRSMMAELGQPVVVDNKPGAGTIVATETVMRAKPDGYTLMLHASEISSVPALKKRSPWNPTADLTPIALVARSSLVYVVNAKVPAKSLQEFVSYGKSKPGELNYGSSGIGSILHFGAIELETESGLSMSHIPYNGGGPLMQALMGGQIEMAVLTPINVPTSSMLHALAQTGNARHPLLPDVPTTSEAGFPSVNQSVTFTLVGPRGLPQNLVLRLQDALQKISSDAAYQAAMIKAGAQVDYKAGTEVTKMLADGLQRAQRLVKVANIPLE
ncbi:Bug family tripartite tricarboxylate transporter substrate binding protein [Hydrogenophaga sp.]|jgi:tripartite-type tricarboxylate transporter receptor subunit TctC|uniref:Bug family tripartite tricarboxylate transporter substrate binding protein n=1 Tax=Hydrogenophaga sp. TaxID=1904254 RepID=UPI003F72162A